MSLRLLFEIILKKDFVAHFIIVDEICDLLISRTRLDEDDRDRAQAQNRL